ncbi:lipase class 3 [Nitrosococcus halophilus Nc 4]|uniref:Lipase class 3 n=1 Tax=Nitrosococcus halophilus (strain Nc4) TaxID=472759 RepID=D5BXN6_NITHN|nr:lipase family protein [Nitrosococcus halophilus]ADE13994.1 lipase class 3 [Nitrosococcus halophilus Nc 4]
MNFVDQTQLLLEASRATYTKPRKFNFERWQPAFIDVFKGDSFTGFIASDDRIVVLSFRGTQINIKSSHDLETSALNWLTNLNYAQIVYDKLGYRVHKGFDNELDSIYSQLPEMVRDHGGGSKQLFITGHSAGGALATIAARRLKEANEIPVTAAHVFSSPRVGDRNFSRSYPLPIFRFERRDDLIPHVPFSPAVAKILGTVFLDRILDFFPNLGAYQTKNIEYIHVGKLFFVDWNDELFYTEKLEGYWGRIMESVLGQPSLPGTPMPKAFMDGGRLLTTFSNVLNQLNLGNRDFLRDHDLEILQRIVRKILKAATYP